MFEESEDLAEEGAEGGHVAVRPLQVGDQLQEEVVQALGLEDVLVVAPQHVRCYGYQHLKTQWDGIVVR